MTQQHLFGIDNQLNRLSDLGDQLETLAMVVDFEVFRPDLIMALCRSDGSKGGRPAYDVVTMFKTLVIGAMNDLSDERLEFLINDRLSFMRFLGFDLGQCMPDARTIWLHRNLLTRADAIDTLFQRCDAMITSKGYLAMGGQIVDATIVPAPKQRLKDEEKAQIKEDKSGDEIWDNPHKGMPQGHRCTLVDKIFQSQNRSQWQQESRACGHCHSCLWRQEAHCHRSTFWFYPRL